MYFWSTDNFLQKISSRSGRPPRVSKNTYPLRAVEKRSACTQSGMTLIDTLVGTFLMVLVFVGVVGVFQLSVDVVTNNRARAGAIALANERMEYVRSLSYEDIGTLGGIPAGDLAQNESVTLNTTSYTRRTLVLYGDDVRDGEGVDDANDIPNDYKLVKVEVSWASRTGNRSVSLVSRFQTPNGMEIDCSSPCGTIEVHVVNALSEAVSNARVDIDNTIVDPDVDLAVYTNANGIARVPGAPVGSGYSIVVSKSGYSTDQTWGSSGQNPSPNPPHVSVANNQTTSLTFAIDRVSSKTVVTKSKADGSQIAGVPFTITGTKIIGSNPTVYKYEQTLGSGGVGTTTISSLEWDTYTVAIDSATGYDIASSCSPQPEYLAPGTEQETILYLAPHTANSLLVDVRNNVGALVPGASVRVVRNPGYDATVSADACGQSFFPSLSTASNYSVTISADGYAPKTASNVQVNGTSKLSVSFD